MTGNEKITDIHKENPGCSGLWTPMWMHHQQLRNSASFFHTSELSKQVYHIQLNKEASLAHLNSVRLKGSSLRLYISKSRKQQPLFSIYSINNTQTRALVLRCWNPCMATLMSNNIPSGLYLLPQQAYSRI